MHPSNPSEFCPATHGWPGWLVDKLVQTLDCSSLQEGHKTKSCPSHQSRTRHSFLSPWLLYFSNHTKSFWGGHGSAHALYPAVTMPRKDLVTGQARTVISVSRGRKCSFGFNCLQKTFFQEIYFFPALPLFFFWLLQPDQSQGVFPGASHSVEVTEWLFLAQVRSQLTTDLIFSYCTSRAR